MNHLTSDDYNLLKQILRQETGIELGQGKEYLVESRLGELCASLKLSGLGEMLAKIRQGVRGELVRSILEAMTTNETYFFRDELAYRSLRQTIFPSLVERNRGRRSLRIWSAACSTGQEPYSIAILLSEQFPELASWNLEILASDIAEGKVLDRARDGIYFDHEVKRGLAEQQLYRYFERVGRHWVLSPTIRRVVSFRKINLLDVPSSIGTFDLILCRNVLIYFDNDTKRRVLSALHQRLDEAGYLVLGGSEVLFGISEDYRRETDDTKGSFYRKAACVKLR